MPALTVERVSTDELRIEGELDRVTVDRFDESVSEAIRGERPLVLDLSGVRFVDSSGIRSLVRLGLSMQGRSLVLRNPSAQVVRVLELTRLDQVGLWTIERVEEPA